MHGFFNRINGSMEQLDSFEPNNSRIFNLNHFSDVLEGNVIGLEEPTVSGRLLSTTHDVRTSSNSPLDADEKIFGKQSFGATIPSNEDSTNSRVAGKPAGKRKEKYMPRKKTDIELFDEELHIKSGQYFKELLKDHVSVSGGKDEDLQLYESFEECRFSPEIMQNLKLLKIFEPTPIQKAVIPLVQNTNGDIVGHAKTGCGKTAAFMLPVVNRIQQLKLAGMLPRRNSESPIAFVISPTRDLCQQWYDTIRTFSAETGVTVAYSIGDTPMGLAIASVREGCDIFIATIGRAVHFVEQQIDENYEKLTLIKEKSNINPKHRTFMFSATFDSDVQYKAGRFFGENTYLVNANLLNTVVKQNFVLVEQYDKQTYLIELLKRNSVKKRHNDETFTYIPEKTIIFVQRKRQSDRIALALAQAGFNVISLNADRTLKQRLEAISRFTRNHYQVLVSTDVGSRGLNFPLVTHIINYDLPIDDHYAYIHRIGRTGRAGNPGYSTSFFDSNRDYPNVSHYIKMLVAVNQEVPAFLLEIGKQMCIDEMMNRRLYGSYE